MAYRITTPKPGIKEIQMHTAREGLVDLWGYVVESISEGENKTQLLTYIKEIEQVMIVLLVHGGIVSAQGQLVCSDLSALTARGAEAIRRKSRTEVIMEISRGDFLDLYQIGKSEELSWGEVGLEETIFINGSNFLSHIKGNPNSVDLRAIGKLDPNGYPGGRELPMKSGFLGALVQYASSEQLRIFGSEAALTQNITVNPTTVVRAALSDSMLEAYRE